MLKEQVRYTKTGSFLLVSKQKVFSLYKQGVVRNTLAKFEIDMRTWNFVRLVVHQKYYEFRLIHYSKRNFKKEDLSDLKKKNFHFSLRPYRALFGRLKYRTINHLSLTEKRICKWLNYNLRQEIASESNTNNSKFICYENEEEHLKISHLIYLPTSVFQFHLLPHLCTLKVISMLRKRGSPFAIRSANVWAGSVLKWKSVESAHTQ